MRKIIVICILLTGTVLFAQHGKLLKRDKLIQDDSVVQQIKVKTDSLISNTLPVDTMQIRREVNNGMDTYLEMSRERASRQKRNAIIRIGVGLGFLALLIVGLSRRRKKTA